MSSGSPGGIQIWQSHHVKDGHMYGTNANFATSTDLSKLSDPSSCSWDDLITAPLVIESKKYLHQNHCQRYYLNVTSIGRGVLITDRNCSVSAFQVAWRFLSDVSSMPPLGNLFRYSLVAELDSRLVRVVLQHSRFV